MHKMETVRVGHSVWGQEVIEGVSWDLLPVAVGIALVVIVGHAIFSRLRRKRGPGE
jgi:hypothetical protein